MIQWQTDPEVMSDAELLAALERARKDYDGPAIDRLFDKIEKRGLHL